MRTIILKVLCWLCVALMTNVLAFHNKHLYSNSKAKDYNKNYRHHPSTSAYNSPTFYNSNSLYNLNNKAVRLRHSRYPNLNSVMTRLDNMQSSTTATTTSTTSTTTHTPETTTSSFRLYNNNRKDKILFDSFSDDDDDLDSSDENDDWDTDDDSDPFATDNYIDDEDETEDDEGINDEESDEEQNSEDDDGSFQAEEATTETITSSSFMDYKSRNYASPNQIEETSRRKNYPEYTTPISEVNAALQHAIRMNTESRCREPLPRVVSIQTEYPDPGKSYVPHCTVLHRCAEDTGCCPNHATICAPKKQVVVQLYFYTSSIGKRGNKVEKLAFTNHTECACLERPRETPTSETVSPEVSRSYRSHLPAKVTTSQNLQSPALPRCKCPEEYTPILLKNSGCTCDCTDSNIDCGLIKRGNEFFSLKDRVCIKNNECGTPKCEYGSYLTHKGRCPRRNEKNDIPTSVN